jgi:hypothetical protein
MAKCAGCEKADHEFPAYSAENPVDEDGSYANGQFVCDSCYIKLDMIDHALSVGRPELIQANAIKYLRKPKGE